MGKAASECGRKLAEKSWKGGVAGRKRRAKRREEAKKKPAPKKAAPKKRSAAKAKAPNPLPPTRSGRARRAPSYYGR